MTAPLEAHRGVMVSDRPAGETSDRVVRHGRVSWPTHPPHGTARIGVESRAFGAVAVSVPEGDVVAHEAAPGELLAVTHAIFMAWKLSAMLAEVGSPPNELTISAECTFAGAVAERELVAVSLQIRGIVPGLDAATFREVAIEAQRRSLHSLGARSDIPCDLLAVLSDPR
jgi:osmotically inducible protein OsmC